MTQIASKPVKIGIFFSHPTQHHSVMFKYLAQAPDIESQVYYYDPGLLTKMFDAGFGVAEAWDVDLLSGTRSTVLPSLLRGREINPYRQVNPGIIKVMARERFDAILVMGYVSPSNWLALCSAKLFGARVLYQSDTNILDERRKKQPWLKRLLRGIFLKRVDTFLVIGNKNRDAYLNLGCDPERMVWCPYPVDTKRFEAARSDPQLTEKLAQLRRQHQIPPDAQVVAFCGKLVPRKRPQDLIDALRLLRRENVYGLLIGSGQLEQSLRDYLTPADQVRITGFVNQQMIPYYMLLADVGVVASEWDPHPLVTTEFAMCGLPVVVSDLCGVWGDHDILRVGENGFIYPCGNAARLGEQLAAILDDEPLRVRMSRRALELSEKQSAEYAAEVIANHLRRTFNDWQLTSLARQE
jgi:glycosyltransferase involved in cell wall biosynthesis